MNPYYKLYAYFLGPKILTEIETLKAKLKKGARVSAAAHRHQVPFGIVFQAGWFLVYSPLVALVQHHLPVGRADST